VGTSTDQVHGPAARRDFLRSVLLKTDAALWTLLRFANCESASGEGRELFTYSSSTSVRAALLAAGFYVAMGRGTGPKAETTIGLTPRAAVDRDGRELAHGRELLGEEWLAKWRAAMHKPRWEPTRATRPGWRQWVRIRSFSRDWSILERTHTRATKKNERCMMRFTAARCFGALLLLLAVRCAMPPTLRSRRPHRIFHGGWWARFAAAAHGPSPAFPAGRIRS